MLSAKFTLHNSFKQEKSYWDIKKKKEIDLHQLTCIEEHNFCFSDYMERFLDDQETPPPTVASRDRSASPVHSLLFGDPKRNHLKPHTDLGMDEHSATFQPVLPDLELNTATPTVPCLDTKMHSPADVDSFSLQNGIHEEGYVPPFKKSKLENLDQNICEISGDLHSSDTQNHIDSLSITSVGKMSVDTPDIVSKTSAQVTHEVEPVGLTSVELGSTRNLEAVTQ